jgi:hypothetical protein
LGIGYSACSDHERHEFLGCTGAAATGVVIGGTVGAISGVYLGGAAAHGDGSFLATAAGGTLGLAAGFAGAALTTAGDGDANGAAVAFVIAAPLVGSVIGYELTTSRARPVRRERAVLRPRVAAAPLKDGGFVSLSGLF